MSKVNTQSMKSQLEQVKKIAKDGLAPILDKNLQDLVRGIRSHRENESSFIGQCIDEIKLELQNESTAVKANAVNKLVYLQMLGHDMSWAAFNVVELMSSTRFSYKRIGYLAATKSFHSGTDLLVLTTNTIRKDLHSSNALECCLALNSLSCFMDENLARDLWRDIIVLLSASKPFVRKRATLLLYKLFLTFPQSLKEAIPKVVDRLNDTDPSVQASAVSVICELARSSPRSFLPLAQTLFGLMNTSTNNWLLIKLIKLVAYLTPLDSSMSKKLIDPLTSLIHSTSAMSLLYECINTVVAILVAVSMELPASQSSAIHLCAQKLSALIEDSDQNLRYLGLLALSRVMNSQAPAQRSHYREIVLRCLEDNDESIRRRALDLLLPLTTRRSLVDIVRKLNALVEPCENTVMRDELLRTILVLCSSDNYECISDFEWYISILMHLARIPTEHAGQIADQIVDIAVRVRSVRNVSVGNCCLLIEENKQSFRPVILDESNLHVTKLLCSAIYVCGEFAQPVDCSEITDKLIHSVSSYFPPDVIAVFLHNLLKLSARANVFTEDVIHAFNSFTHSADADVQERACEYCEIVKLAQKYGASVFEELSGIFAEDLNPVSPIAQKCVPIPDDLNLDEWINEPFEDKQFDDVTFEDATLFQDGIKIRDEDTEGMETYQNNESSDYETYQRPKYESNPYYIKSIEKQNGDESQSYTKEERSKKIDEENKRLHRKMRFERPSVFTGEEMPVGANIVSSSNLNENDDVFSEILEVVQATAEKVKEKTQLHFDRQTSRSVGNEAKSKNPEATKPDAAVKASNDQKRSLPSKPKSKVRRPSNKKALDIIPAKGNGVEEKKDLNNPALKSHLKDEISLEDKCGNEKKSVSKSKRRKRIVKRDTENKAVCMNDTELPVESKVPEEPSQVKVIIAKERKDKFKTKRNKEKAAAVKDPIEMVVDSNKENTLCEVDDLLMLGTDYPYEVETLYCNTNNLYNGLDVKGWFVPQLNQLLELHLIFSVANHSISDLKIDIVNSLSLAIIYVDCKDPSASLVRFRVNGISFPQKMKCSIKYTVDQNTAQTVDFPIFLPVSRFLVKGNVRDLELFSVERTVEVSTGSGSVLSKILVKLPFTQVSVANLACLEARTVLNQPVRLLLGNNGNSKIDRITVKSVDDGFVFSLSEEIRAIFK